MKLMNINVAESVAVAILEPMVDPKPVQFRAQLPPDLDLLIRAIAPLKNSGKDWTLSDITVEALINWIKQPENQALIEKHNLLQALRDRGYDTEIYDGRRN